MTAQSTGNGQASGRPVVIVTGSSGMLGGTLIRNPQLDYQFIGFDRDGEPQPPPEVECVVMDVTDDSSVNLALHRVAYAYGKRLAAFVHLAAYVDFTASDSDLYDEVTVQGTARLLKHLHEQEFECERFIFSSTMLVHEPTEPGRPIDEDSPCAPKWGYPRSKVEAERVVREYAGEYPTAALRIAGVYTDQGGAPTIAQQIHRVHEKQITSHVVPGTPEHGQAFVHLDDTLGAIRQTIARRHDLPRRAVYLIGEPETYSYQHLQDAIGRALHGRDAWETIRVPERLAQVGASVRDATGSLPGVDAPFIKPFMIEMFDDHYELDIRRAERDLHWRPRRRLIDTIPTMCRSLLEDPEGWRRAHGIAG